ncbi:MAG: RIP metalloprotease RseP [Saprospiraceae bacterium]|uniref:Zinc metalloprotease n=1 Tax=Candidatus Opimibacter skivensis TaxID=2982028 RepID=A0A9D7SVV4_9BACT|nr:RIP metalloprotease RseP [Candidatus Opimibacter skivensis]
MGIVIMIAQLILSLSILVVLHEMGHFIPAKWFKTRVEKFYLFFDPKFSLVKKKIGETEYGIGWLPLGGYVKIAGMVDESMDLEQLKAPPQPWEFRSKPAWQRLIIMLGGVTVNFLLGFLIFGMMLWVYGKEYLVNDKMEYGIYADSLGTKIGLMDGDKILSVGGEKMEEFSANMLRRQIVLNNAKDIIVHRDSQDVTVNVDPKFIPVLASNFYKDYTIIGPRIPFVVGEVSEKSNAEKAGLQKDDHIVSIDGKPMMFQHEVMKAFSESKGKTIDLGYTRNGVEQHTSITINEKGKIGIVLMTPHDFKWTAREDYSLASAIPAGFHDGVSFMGDWFKGIAQIFKGKVKAKDSLGGFISITKLFSTSWDWEAFWRITGILSFILAIMNLLPIPALDGGHVMFLLWEVATGKKPGDKFMEYATYVGFALVLGLLVFANGLDIMRLFGK